MKYIKEERLVIGKRIYDGECMERTEDINRQQPLFLSFDEILQQDSMARVIDRFISICDLWQMGFQPIGSKETGRPRIQRTR